VVPRVSPELREAGAVAVFESVDELRKRLDETALG